MTIIELLERPKGSSEVNTLSITGVSSLDLNFLLELSGGMVSEIYRSSNRNGLTRQILRMEDTIFCRESSRTIKINNILLLRTVLQGHVRHRPDLKILVKRLEGENTHLSEIWIRELNTQSTLEEEVGQMTDAFFEEYLPQGECSV